MNGVVFYSNTGQSRCAAQYLSQRLGWPCYDIADAPAAFETLILVFPVHCQRIPDMVGRYLDQTRAQWLVPIATYGRMHHGDVLRQIQRRWKFAIPAAMYLPAKHAYLPDSLPLDPRELDPLLSGLEKPAQIRIPRSWRNPLSDLFPGWRSRMGVVLARTEDCSRCGLCSRNCPRQAMTDGVPNGRCIRCLRCAQGCPRQALVYRLRPPMARYLRKTKAVSAEVYLPSAVSK